MGKKGGDAGFRLGTGVFALALVLIVLAIGFELSRQSLTSIQTSAFCVVAMNTSRTLCGSNPSSSSSGKT